MLGVEHRTRVLVVDDSEAMRYSLRQYLFAFGDMEWVGEASAEDDTVEQCEVLRPDVILLDAGLPHLDLPQLTRTLRGHFPLMQIIALASFEDADTLQSLLDAGVALVLPKDAPIMQIADALRELAHRTET